MAERAVSVGRSAHGPLCPDGRAAAEPPSAAPCPPNHRPFVLAATILASAMAFIDGTVITIALPILQADLDTSFAAVQWVVNAYTLTLGALILVGGGLGDRLGRRRVFVWGIVVFAIASVVCALAPNAPTLIAGRAVQGIGAAMLVPQSLAIIAAAFPKDVRGRAIGAWAAASAITTAIGPLIGGVLIDAAGWRMTFWMNLPMAAAALWLAVRFVPESRDERADAAPLDWAGAGLGVIALGALMGALTLAASGGDGAIATLLGVVGLIAAASFVVAERRAHDPIVPMDLFGSRAFTGANAMTVCLYGALGGVLFLLPFELVERRGMSPTETGLVFAPFGVIIGVASRFAGAWADRVGERLPLALGSLVAAAAIGALALNPPGLAVGVVIPVMALALGMALVVAPLSTAVMNAAPDARAGAASGVNNAASRLAGLVAVVGLGAIASLVFGAALNDPGLGGAGPRFGLLPDAGAASRAAHEAAFLAGYRIAMAAAAFAALAAAVIAALALRPAPAAP